MPRRAVSPEYASPAGDANPTCSLSLSPMYPDSWFGEVPVYRGNRRLARLGAVWLFGLELFARIGRVYKMGQPGNEGKRLERGE